MNKRCFGRTKSLQRCARNVEGWFCADHRWQVPVGIATFVLGLFTFLANYATVSQFFSSFFYQPRIEISLGKLTADDLKTDPLISVKRDASNWIELDFSVKNLGNAPLQKPVAAIHAMPPSIVLVRINGAHDPSRPNAIQFSGDTVDLQPFDTHNTTYKFTVRAKVPLEVSDCSFNFRIYGDNLKISQQKVRLKLEA